MEIVTANRQWILSKKDINTADGNKIGEGASTKGQRVLMWEDETWLSSGKGMMDYGCRFKNAL